MIRTGIALILLLFCGCVHNQPILSPTDDWSYFRLDEIDGVKDADLCLVLYRTLDGFGELSPHTIFFKKQNLPRPRPVIGQRGNWCFYDGEGWSSGQILGSEVSHEHVMIHTGVYYISEKINFDFDEELSISYAQTGQCSSGKLHCKWEWLELDSPKKWSLLSEKTSVDWQKIIEEEKEGELSESKTGK